MQSGYCLRSLIVTCLISVNAPAQPLGGLLQDRGPQQQISGTTLKVTLPPDWQVQTATSGSPQLKHSKPPEYSLLVSQATTLSVGFSCINLLGSIQASPSSGTRLIARPAFIPNVYFGSVLVVSTAQLTCLSMSDGLVGVMIQLPRGEPRPEVLTPMLTALAEAGFKQSHSVSSPGRLKLPLLGIEVPIREGAWGIQNGTDVWGRNDILGRPAQPGRNELHITPFVFKAPGRCESLLTKFPNAATTGAVLAKGRNYGGARWYADALEQFPPPFKALQAYACRNVGRNSILLARIDYEKVEVTPEDRSTLRQLLEDIGDEVDRKLDGK
jgi:hypothetical protein